MKNIRVVNKKRFFISISLILFIALSIASICIAKVSAKQQNKYKAVYVEDNDSLWSISSKVVSNDVDIRDYIQDVKRINNLESSILQPGQKLLLPIGE